MQTGGCQVRANVARFTPRTIEREMRSAWWDIKESEYSLLRALRKQGIKKPYPAISAKI